MNRTLHYYQFSPETQYLDRKSARKKPQELPISTMKNPVVVINEATATALGITFPADILETAKKVTDLK